MILVLMFSVFTIPVHGEVLTMTTAVGVTVIAAALITAGVYIASPNTREAINAAARDFISRNADFLTTVKLVAKSTGAVFSVWSSTMWNKFINWINTVLFAGEISLISGYALQIIQGQPSDKPYRTEGFNTYGVIGQQLQNYAIGGSFLTNEGYETSGIFRLKLANGISLNQIGCYTSGLAYIPSPSGIYYSNGNFRLAIYQPAMWYTGEIVGNPSSATGFIVNQMPLQQSWYIYNQRVDFVLGANNTIRAGSATGPIVAYGFQSVMHYIIACISAGIFFGDFSFITGGQNINQNDYYDPTVGVSTAGNTIPGLAGAPNTGAINENGLPISANPGQDIVIPVWGTWTNGQGIPIGWAGPQGTYGTPSSTITPGTTIAGSNPTATYPGDDVINPTLGRDGVAPFPTLGDDVINPADDTFITDLDDYIDPTIDKLTSPTDVTTLTQNPTDVLGPTTDVYPESDDIPNTIRDTATDTIPDVDSPAIPDVDTATDTANPINPDAPDDTADDERNTNRLKLSTLILSKFPFCIPWDIYRTVATMVQEPEIPSFDWRFSLPTFNIDETIHIDFEQFETVAYIVRWFLSACWLVTLVLLTRKVIWK